MADIIPALQRLERLTALVPVASSLTSQGGWDRAAAKFEQVLAPLLPAGWADPARTHDWIAAIKDLVGQMDNCQLTWLTILNSPALTDRLGELLRHYGQGDDQFVKVGEGLAVVPGLFYQPDDPLLYACLDDIIAAHLARFN